MRAAPSDTAAQRRYVADAVAGLAAVTFATMFIIVTIAPANQFDRLGSRAAHELMTTRMLIPAVRAVTALGSTMCLAAVALLATAFLLWTGRRRDALRYVVACALSSVVVNLLKLTVGRPRPADGLVHGSGYAFPSGHATNSTVVYGLLALVVISHITTARRRTLIILVAGSLIVGIAVSRVLLDVHWITDVVAGISLGVTIAALAYISMNKTLNEFSPPTARGHDRQSRRFASRRH